MEFRTVEEFLQIGVGLDWSPRLFFIAGIDDKPWVFVWERQDGNRAAKISVAGATIREALDRFGDEAEPVLWASGVSMSSAVVVSEDPLGRRIRPT